MIKRLFDIIVSISLLLVLFPVFLVVAIFIKLDGGSVIYKQNRVGLNGKVFGIYKFRSMVVGADKLGGHSTIPGDKRVTAIGKIIRKTSVDELPQLVNVVLGHMSLVGPRPNVPAQRNEYTQEQWDLRNSVLPGITGIAQARKRSNATWEERYELDVEYVKTTSLFVDLRVVFETIKQVLFKGGY